MSDDIVSLDAYRGRKSQALDYVDACERYLVEIDMPDMRAASGDASVVIGWCRMTETLSCGERALDKLPLADLEPIIPILTDVMRVVQRAAAGAALPPAG